MRPLILVLSLLLPSTALGQETPAAPEPTAEPAPAPAEATGEAAATVLRHEVLVVVDSARRATTTRTWEVRIDDPAACAAGLIAPEGLDGATDGEASILEDTLLLPEDVQAGAVFTLEQQSRTEYRGSHSGAFLTAPDLPTEQARFEVRAPSWVPLHVWHDDDGLPENGTRGGRSMVITWSDLEAGTEGQAVWSTWEDWITAGTEISDLVDEKVASKSELGRDMSSGYTGLHLGEAAERIAYAVDLDPNGTRDWKDARPATEVMADGKGSPVDRGVVLLSLLRLASYDAEPGYFRPADARGTFPITVPAPAMLGRPLIVVHRDDGDVFIDLGAEYVAVPERPASVIGGVTWVPGDLPTPLRPEAQRDGVVHINATLTLDPDGSATWTADLSAEGTALQWLRERLAPLDEANRTAALQRLVAASRPGTDRFAVTASGLEKVRATLKLKITGRDTGLLQPMGSGLMGEVPALVAPALAAWLPPNILVEENLAIQVPRSVEIVAAAPPESAFSDDAILARTTDRSGARVVLRTEVERPKRVNTSAREVAARDFLTEEAARGPVLVVHAAANRDTVKALRVSDLPAADRYVLEAVLWWKQRVLTKASRSLRFAFLEQGSDATAAALSRYAPQQGRLWRSLLGTAEDHGTAADRLAILRATVAAGHERMAWAAAAELALDEDLPASDRADALLIALDVQPEDQPDAERAPDAHARWAEPTALLDQVEALVGADDPRVLERRARLAADAGSWDEVSSLLDRLPADGQSPGLKALRAQAMAETGAAVADVIGQLDEALNTAPYDPDVLVSAAAVASFVGETRRAAASALSAARIRPDDPRRWTQLAQLSMAAGDLPTAAVAARRASDLRPKAPRVAERLALVSALVHDEAGFEAGRQRNPEALKGVSFPPPLAQLMEIAPPEALLGVLQFHDDAVVADPNLLAIRAQMRLDAGLLDEAARDGVLLATRHGQPDGIALAYAASAGRVFSTTWGKRLDEAANDSIAARSTRMEVGLLTGSSDPTIDARALEGDPRAAVIARLRSDPKGLAAEVEGWPVDAKSPWFRGPDGYRTNARLGAAPGVSAVSNPATGTAILRSAPVEGVLPPPLGALYTPGEQVLAELDGDGTVVRLDGGPLPLFLGRASLETDDGPVAVYSLGFSVPATSRALARALE